MTASYSVPQPAPTVRVVDATLSYSGSVVFDELSVAIEAGLWTGLLGPSGIGKSSLLRAIAGLPVLDGTLSGQFTCSEGTSLSGRVSYMAQRDLLLPWLTVLDNVLVGSRLRGQPVSAEDRNKAAGLLEAVGLGDSGKALPSTLSGGMRQRAALARTLMEDRPVILMDEPFSALDAVTRARLQDLACEMLEGRTVFLVTHDPTEALRLCDRIHLLTGQPAALSAFSEIPDLCRPRPPSHVSVAEAAGALLDRLAA